MGLPAATHDVEDESRDHFPFLKLSAELRLMIYRAALRHDEPLSLSIQKTQPPARSDGDQPSDDDSAEGQHAATHSAEAMALRLQQVARARHIEMLRAAVMRRSPLTRGITTGLQLPPDLRPPQASETFPAEASTPTTTGSTDEDEVEPPAQARTNLVPNILCLNKQINREARSVLYSENVIELDIRTSIFSINSLRQPIRSLLKHIRITIGSYHDILDRFSDLVRLALRYCWGMQTLTICLTGGWQPTPRDSFDHTGATKLYANAFNILRWLPKDTTVTLEGHPSAEMRKVVEECRHEAQELDEVAYQKRQLQMDERD